MLFYSASFIGNSVFRDGDSSIWWLRYRDDRTAETISVALDMRLPLGRATRLSPRLVVSNRTLKADGSTQWIVSPAVALLAATKSKLPVTF